MSRRKKLEPVVRTLADLLLEKDKAEGGSQTSALRPDSPPALLEYTALDGERMRVEKFELLAAELDLRAGSREQGAWSDLMVHLHELGARFPRQWSFARRVFGIAPMLIPDGATPEDFSAQSREAVGATFGISAGELRAELDALRTLWRDHVAREQIGEKLQGEHPTTNNQPPTSNDKPQGEIVFAGDILRRHGFDEVMFETMVFDPKAEGGKGGEVLRAAEKNRVEKEWFAGRVQAWDKLLSDTRAESTAREALMNQLYLRRLAVDQAIVPITSPRFRDLSELKRRTEEALARQMKDLAEMFPELDTVKHRAITLSDYNRAFREWYGRKDRQLFDRVFTPNEREVLDRMSVQSPAPQFRFGQHVAIIEAMHFLYDANFRTQLKPDSLKRMDAGYKAGVAAWREQNHVPLPDLEDGVLPGEGQDHADLLEPALG